jgi:ParB-like chromosome segregation protein Spo0J
MAETWPADKIERWPLDRLTPYAMNSRLHSPQQVNQIAASIKEWGWTTPVLADPDGTIICGHGRVLAAQKLGITSVPVMVADGWTDTQRRAYVIADNRLGDTSKFDDEILASELGSLSEDGFDLSTVGFDMRDLDKLLAGDPTDPRMPDPEHMQTPHTCPACGHQWVGKD